MVAAGNRHELVRHTGAVESFGQADGVLIGHDGSDRHEMG